MSKENMFLTLDGGGSKGIYTLSILEEIENLLPEDQVLNSVFGNIYGTSTGSIIATWIALGKPVKDLKKLYLELIPEIMSPMTAKGKSKVLSQKAKELFGNNTFEEINCNLGIVASDYNLHKPVIFKTKIKQAHDGKESFVAGFGAKLSDAVEGSCSAYPFFAVKDIETNFGNMSIIDGGFVANNPSITAYIDATKSLGVNENTKILSIGTGDFTEKKPFFEWLPNALKIGTGDVLTKLFDYATSSQAQYLKLLAKDEIKFLRVNGRFSKDVVKTNLFEKDLEILGKLQRLGRETYLENINEIKEFMGIM